MVVTVSRFFFLVVWNDWHLIIFLFQHNCWWILKLLSYSKFVRNPSAVKYCRSILFEESQTLSCLQGSECMSKGKYRCLWNTQILRLNHSFVQTLMHSFKPFQMQSNSSKVSSQVAVNFLRSEELPLLLIPAQYWISEHWFLHNIGKLSIIILDVILGQLFRVLPWIFF